jgi:hypothetical protein
VTVGPATQISPISPSGTSSRVLGQVDRLIGNRDDAHLVGRQRPADADALARAIAVGQFADQFAPGHGGHRQGFGRAIRGVDVGPGIEGRVHAFDHFRRHRGTGGQRALHARNADLAVLFQVAAERVHECRRTEQVGHAIGLDQADQHVRVGLGRSGEVHDRNDRGHAQRRVEQGERREGRQVDFPGLIRKSRAAARPGRRTCGGDRPRPWEYRSSRR